MSEIIYLQIFNSLQKEMCKRDKIRYYFKLAKKELKKQQKLEL